MTLARVIQHLAIAVIITLHSCNGQSQNNAKSVVVNGPPFGNNTDGIVYFSYDNGLTWENKSTGLPSTAAIGLGGIAVSGDKLALLSKDSGLYFFNAQEDRWINIPTDKHFLQSNPGALLFFKDHLYAGTQFGGIFRTGDKGKSWAQLNTGLENLTIRKLAKIENTLYAGTNSGLYSYNDVLNQWELEYGGAALQVNGITNFNRTIVIATNQGAFASPMGKNDWKKIFSNGALHNISSSGKALYAMVYNELFSSFDKGRTWQNIQRGLPAQLYTFNVVTHDNTLLAGQWNGVYRKERESENWKLSSNGLPEKYAIANMQVYNKIIVVSGNERKLRTGMTTEK